MQLVYSTYKSKTIECNPCQTVIDVATVKFNFKQIKQNLNLKNLNENKIPNSNEMLLL